MAKATLRPGDLRSNAEKIADEVLKEHVLNGIKRLEEVYGTNWVDHIDPGSLMLSSARSCVLGQVFEWDNLTPAQREEAKGYGHDSGSYGFYIGVDLLNIDENPADYAFDEGDHNYAELQNAWQVVLGFQ